MNLKFIALVAAATDEILFPLWPLLYTKTRRTQLTRLKAEKKFEGKALQKSRKIRTGLFFQPLCGNAGEWIFRNLEFNRKLLEVFQKILEIRENLP